MDEDALWAVPLGGVEGHKVRVKGELKVSCGVLKGWLLRGKNAVFHLGVAQALRRPHVCKRSCK